MGRLRRRLAAWLDPTLGAVTDKTQELPLVPSRPPEDDVWMRVARQFAHRVLAASYRMSADLGEAVVAEQDPDRLHRLYRLDHVNTGVRRQAENLQVLAGVRVDDAGRQITTLLDVLRAAAAAVEDYPRVHLGPVAAVAVGEPAVTEFAATGLAGTGLVGGGLTGTGLSSAGLASTGLAVAGLAGTGVAVAGLATTGVAVAELASTGLAGTGLAGTEPAVTELAVIEDAADDVIRVLTELLDNATRFSPPRSPVTVATQLTEHGHLLVRIDDDGAGLDPAVLAHVNAALAGDRPLTFDPDNPASRLGFPVVQRLALAHRLQISLVPRTPTGTTATVLVPSALLCEKRADPATVDSGLSGVAGPIGPRSGTALPSGSRSAAPLPSGSRSGASLPPVPTRRMRPVSTLVPRRRTPEDFPDDDVAPTSTVEGRAAVVAATGAGGLDLTTGRPSESPSTPGFTDADSLVGTGPAVGVASVSAASVSAASVSAASVGAAGVSAASVSAASVGAAGVSAAGVGSAGEGPAGGAATGGRSARGAAVGSAEVPPLIVAVPITPLLTLTPPLANPPPAPPPPIPPLPSRPATRVPPPLSHQGSAAVAPVRHGQPVPVVRTPSRDSTVEPAGGGGRRPALPSRRRNAGRVPPPLAPGRAVFTASTFSDEVGAFADGVAHARADSSGIKYSAPEGVGQGQNFVETEGSGQ